MSFDQNIAFRIAAQVSGADQVQGLQKDVNFLANSVKFLASSWAVKEMFSFTKGIIDLGAELERGSKKSGIAVSELGKLKVGAEAAGLSFEDLENGLKNLAVAMVKAEGGNEKFRLAFSNLGINIEASKGRLKTASDVMLQMGDRFSEFSDGATKSGYASILLGKSIGDKFVPFLDDGSKSMEEFNLKIGDDFAKSAEKFDKSSKLLKSAFEGLGAKIIAPAVGPVTTFLNYLTSQVDNIYDKLKEFALKFTKPLHGAAGDIYSAYVFSQGPQSSSTTDDDKKKKKAPPAIADPKNLIDAAERAHKIAIGNLDLDKPLISENDYKRRKDTIDFNLEIDKAQAEGNTVKEAAIRLNKIDIDTLRDREEAAKKNWGRGAQEAIRDYVDTATNSAALMKQAFTGAFSRIEDALVEFVKTGKINFHSLIQYMSDELIRIAVKQAIMAPALGFIGSFFSSPTPPVAHEMGGIMGPNGSVPLKKYSSGGIATSPQFAMFGEGSTPEAYVPLPDGRAIPVNMKGGGGDNFNINISVNDGGAASGGDNSKAGQLGKAITAVVRNELIQQKRPGGILA